MDLVRWEPFEGLSRIQNRINDLLDDTFGRARSSSMAAPGVWFPPVDILESRDSYLIRAELPGMKREDFNLEVHDGSLTLSGERKFDEAANGVEYHRVERASGKFSRSMYQRLMKRNQSKSPSASISRPGFLALKKGGNCLPFLVTFSD